jgi:hypothetical protein
MFWGMGMVLEHVYGVCGMGVWGVACVLTYLLIGMVHGSGKEVSKGVRGSCIKVLTLHLGTPQAGKASYQLTISRY